MAKKTESNEFNDDVEAVLTFNDLRLWLEDEGITPDILKYREQDQFYPKQAFKGSLYPIDGGMITSIKSGRSVMQHSVL